MDDLDLGQTLRGFAAGQRILSRFTLTRMLGRGGMGVVWLAHDEKLELDVALKFLPELVANDPGAVSDLKRETRRSLQLTHPHIVRIYDFVEDGRVAAVSMEFVDGASLTQRRLEQPLRVFEPQELRSWVEQLCGALQYAHAKARIVHRDLKPANLMVDKQGDLKVADFGISATLADTTTRVSNQAGSSGTPVYMSLQQMMGEKPAETDDIYSLGATLYELLTGKPPFYSGNILLQVQSKMPPSMAERRVELGVEGGAPIPVSWETVIAACLAKEPGRRPQSAQELATALLGAPDQPFRPQVRAVEPPRPAPARVATPATPAKIRKPLSRGRKWALAGGAAAVLLVVVWQGDVINRIKAGGLHKEAVRQQVAGETKAALRLAHDVVALRPTDAEYRRAYEALQRSLLKDLESQAAALEPEQAYALMQAERTATDPYLDGRFSERFSAQSVAVEQRLKDWVAQGFSRADVAAQGGRFAEAYREVDRVRGSKAVHPEFDASVTRLQADEVRFAMREAGALAGTNEYERALAKLTAVQAHAELVPEYAATLLRTREGQVRYEIAQALAASAGGRFEEAQAQLMANAKRGLLLDEIEAARSRVGRQAELASIEAMAQALRDRKPAQAQQVIDRLGAFTGKTFKTTAAALDAETNLSAFLASLTELRIRPAPGDKREGHQDLVLVESCKARFRDQAAVERFLAQEYGEWSQTMAEAGMPGCALYLAGLAETHGTSFGPEYRKTLQTQAAKTLAAGVRVAAAQAGEVALQRQASTLRDKFSHYLLDRFSAWLRTPSSSDGVGVEFRLGALETQHDKQESSGSSRYQSGTRRTASPMYPQAVQAVQMAEMRLNNANATSMANSSARLQRTSLGGTADLGTACMDLGNAAQDAAAVITATNQLSAARRNLNNTPEIIEEPVYDTEPYRIVDHALVHGLTATATFAVEGKTVGEPLRWGYEQKESTREIIGDASHGVPVAKPKYMTRDAIVDSLMAAMTPAVEDKNAILVLENALCQWTVSQVAVRKLDGLHRADLIWCLRELWTKSGETFRNDEDALKIVRGELGLPAIP